MDAVNLLLRYIYSIGRTKVMKKVDIYNDFFNAPFVARFLDIHGLDVPTESVRCRRIPFLFNILESVGVIKQSSSTIEVLSFVPSIGVMRLNDKEDLSEIFKRISNFKAGTLPDDELSMLKEEYGPDFGTERYYLQNN